MTNEKISKLRKQTRKGFNRAKYSGDLLTYKKSCLIQQRHQKIKKEFLGSNTI